MYILNSSSYWFLLWTILIFVGVYVLCFMCGLEYFGALALSSVVTYAFLVFNVEFVQEKNTCNVVYVATCLLFFSICTSYIIQTTTLRKNAKRQKPLKKLQRHK